MFVCTLVFADDLFSRVLAMPHSTSQVESGSGWTRKSLSTRGAREKAKAKPKAKAKAERPRARARGSLAINYLNCGSCEWALSVTVLWKVQFRNATLVERG